MQPARELGISLEDVRGWGKLAFDATVGVTGIVEAMHHNIARGPPFGDASARTRASGITGLVYRTVTGTMWLLGTAFDWALQQAPARTGRASSPDRERLLSALNGVLGDHLAATGNPLAIPMSLRIQGRSLRLERRALAAALPRASGKIAVLVHGLCMTDLRWSRLGHDHGAALGDALGYTPIYVRYNTGLHVSTNGRRLAALLEELVREWPCPVHQVALIGHSMGGLVARSACHYGATHDWRHRLERIVFLGTPHHGATLERCGNWLDGIVGRSRYTAPFTRLGQIRSAGITDLRHGSLLDEDWDGRDRFARECAPPRAVPLPEDVACYTVAASRARAPVNLYDTIVGDGLVPVESALGRHRDPARDLAFPEARRWLGRGMDHFDLLSHPDVWHVIRRWMRS